MPWLVKLSLFFAGFPMMMFEDGVFGFLTRPLLSGKLLVLLEFEIQHVLPPISQQTWQPALHVFGLHQCHSRRRGGGFAVDAPTLK